MAKGGVGKTSLAGNTAYLASRTRRVVLVDVLKGEAELSDALVQLAPNLELLPSRGLTGGDLKTSPRPLWCSGRWCSIVLQRALAAHGADLVVYDLSPGLSSAAY